MKVVYPVCCGVDVHKSFFIATIISTASDIQPNYSRKRFSTFNNDIIRFADWLTLNNCNFVSALQKFLYCKVYLLWNFSFSTVFNSFTLSSEIINLTLLL